MLELNGSLKPYLKVSAGAHAALIIALAILAGGTDTSSTTKTYRIDFIGDTGTILNRNLKTGGPTKKAAPVKKKVRRPLGRPKLAPMRDPDAVALGKPSFSKSNLKPSFLKPRTKGKPAPIEKPAAPSPLETPVAAEASSGSGTDTGEGAGSAAVSADMPDFPYPWYLQRLRASLWNHWSLKMPSGSTGCGVVFTVLRGGKVVDLRVEMTSGDSAYDLQALTTVKAVSPFPPLPPQFKEKFLKVHVQFKSN